MTISLSVESLELLVQEALEQAAFLFVDPVKELVLPSQLVQASLSFTGPACGCMTLTTTPGVANQVAANMLGVDMDDGDSAKHADNALGELLNILAGMMTPRLSGSPNKCTLHPPRVIHIASVLDSPTATLSVQFTAGQHGPMRLDVLVQDGDQPAHPRGATTRDSRPGGG